MEVKGKTIFVAGSTGHQGGAAARHLLQQGWHVRGLTRDPSQPSARALTDGGAEIVQGDLLDRASLDPLLDGVYGVFSVETAAEAGPAAEVQEGRNLLEAAKAAGVQHFVYSSHHAAGDPEAPQPWVRSKIELEGYVRNSGITWTIWRPATFMENFLDQREGIVNGVLRGPEPPDMMKQYIAVDDIGRFVAESFVDRNTWAGETTLIAGDRLTMAEVAAVFGRVLGVEVRYEQVPQPEGTPPPRPPREMAEIEELRRHLPGLKTLAEWAERVDWGLERAGTSRAGRVGTTYGTRR